MSMEAIIDDEPMDQVATNTGWFEFCDWADAQTDCEALRHLSFYGHTQRLKQLTDEIDVALAKSPPDPDVESVARGLQEIVRARPNGEVLIVTGEG